MAMDASVFRWRLQIVLCHNKIHNQLFFIFLTDTLRMTSRTECRESTSMTRPSNIPSSPPRLLASWTPRRTTVQKLSRWAKYLGFYSTAGVPLISMESPRLLNISSSLPSSSALVPRRPWQTWFQREGTFSCRQSLIKLKSFHLSCPFEVLIHPCLFPTNGSAPLLRTI